MCKGKEMKMIEEGNDRRNKQGMKRIEEIE